MRFRIKNGDEAIKKSRQKTRTGVSGQEQWQKSAGACTVYIQEDDLGKNRIMKQTCSNILWNSRCKMKCQKYELDCKDSR